MTTEIKYSEWRALSLPEKTEVYFRLTKYKVEAQSKFVNDWTAAFQWFELNYTK